MEASEIVSQTATKFKFDKLFVVGAIAGATTVVLVVGAKKLKDKIVEKRAEAELENAE